ncbi:hypothetical protein KUH03_07455 [Sphingobacterium sp. E70]|uniref:triple tyrosine motif-containing protein n=1 Tax=Sphingobacterium sp. E70 TaxID=2853439 RepID=UPI00211CCB35|nr:triple tyrosine motif-containing protein [Sphingobacterium sp. E70]ULT26668.1 hypothetical protein KUH03_07455 [Sphingobacterium sp. E70]
MEGYDKGWTDITGNQRIYYNKLPPGTYTFRFKGANNNGIWNPTEKELRIVVSPLGGCLHGHTLLISSLLAPLFC